MIIDNDSLNLKFEIGVLTYSSFACMPKSQRTASFLYLLSPRELILIAGSLPLLPHLLMVNGETRSTCATSRTVSRSGRLLIDIFWLYIDNQCEYKLVIK